MNKGLNTHAFTVVEVLIVLAVTGSLLVMAISLISGQQGRTGFTQSINDLQAQINDVINNVATGYYANNNNVTCTAPGASPVLATPGIPTNTQGQNNGCVFLGRAMQFDVGGDTTAFNVYDIVGLQKKNGSTQSPQTLTDAAPLAIAPPNPADTTQHLFTQYGLSINKMYYTNNGVPTPPDITTFALTSSLAGYSNGNLVSGSKQVELHPVKSSASIAAGGEAATLAVQKINAANLDYVLYPDLAVTMCFNSDSSDQSGIITIGSNGRQLSTTLQINNGKCT